MARTNRPPAVAAAPTPPANVERLDDLDLDGLFNEGEDTFFDGLDIDMDGMTEISTTKKTEANAPLNNFNMQSQSAAAPTASTTAAAPSDETPKRRKTKRKIKAPAQLDEYDNDDFEEAPKKKRRASKASAKKGKGTKAAKAAASKVSATMPPPFSRGTMDPNTMVAAAPQMYGYNQKKGAPGQPLVRQTSSSSLSTGSNLSSSATSKILSGGAHSTYCGLLPSNTEFYPFMAAVPAETTVRKTQFPLMNSIHAAITTTAAITQSSNAVKETEGIYRLLSADLDLTYNDRNTSQASKDQRRANLGHVIASARKTVQQADQKNLLKSFRSMCFLLKRQHDFLNQNMSNMERWCRENYSAADYQSVYGSLPSGMRPMPSMPQRTTSLIASLKSPIVKIKVRCTGFKPPKPYLVAHVRLPRTTAQPSTKSDSSRTSTTKKRKLADTDRYSLPSLVVEEPVIKELTYVDMKPSQRRRHVADAVAQRAQTLELQIKESREKHRRSIERQRAEQQKIVDDDEIVSVNTMTMWKWLEKSPHFADYTDADLKQVLENVWEPELVNANVLTKPAETALSRPSTVQSPGDSVFLRLQSLLVDEGSDDNDEGDEDDDWMVEDYGPTVKETSKGSVMLDLSRFSLEERTLIHLRAAGLVDDTCIRAVATQPSLVDENNKLPSKEPSDKQDAPRGNQTKSNNEGESDIDAVILSMQAELLDQRRVNNARLGFLESAARSHIESTKESKRREDENASMVARYNQMLKKQKEAKKSTRTRPTNDDGAWMPW